MKLKYQKFKYPQDLVDWVNEKMKTNGVFKDDIETISTGRNFITVYYWASNEKQNRL